MQQADREDYIRILSESRSVLLDFLPLAEVGESDDALFDRQMSLARASLSCPDVAVRRVIERDGHVIGVINLNDIQGAADRSAEIVVWISRSESGHGYAAEAIDAVAADALATAPTGIDLSILYALVSPANVPALRSFTHAGFDELPGVPLVELNIRGDWRAHMVLFRSAPRNASTHRGTPDSTAPAHNPAKVVVRRLMASSIRAR